MKVQLIESYFYEENVFIIGCVVDYRVCCRTSLLKTPWEKQKLLVTSNLSFSHSVFYSFRELSAIFIKFEFVVCRLFQFERSLKFVVWERVNPFPHDKILDQTKLKAFADDKLIVTKMIISVFDRVENIVGKGEIACTSNFSFSHNVFKRILSQRHLKVSLCGNGLRLKFCCILQV